MKVIITTDHQGRCEQLVWEKIPFRAGYKLHLEINGEIVHSERVPFSREYVAKSIRSARGVVGREYVTILR